MAVSIAEMKLRNDWIEVHHESEVLTDVKVRGCLSLLEKAHELKKKKNQKLTEIEEPVGKDHASLMIKEVLQKAKTTWTPPYQEEELCHCRAIPLEVVQEAILSGFHDVKTIAKETSAGTACGNCVSDSQKLINYRLK